MPLRYVQKLLNPVIQSCIVLYMSVQPMRVRCAHNPRKTMRHAAMNRPALLSRHAAATMLLLSYAHTPCMSHAMCALLIPGCPLPTVPQMHMLRLLTLTPLTRALLIAIGACVLAGHDTVLC